MGSNAAKGCCSNAETGYIENGLGNYEGEQFRTQENEDKRDVNASNPEIRKTFGKKSVAAKESPKNQDLPPEYIKRIQKLAEIVDPAPKLRLKIISSSVLEKGLILEINAQGLEGSFRNAKDGLIYFGCKKRPKRMTKTIRQVEMLNDFIIPANDKEISKKHRGRHFQIEFDIPNSTYIMKDLGNGFGAFHKLDNPLPLKDNYLINIGLVYIIVNLSFGDTENEESDANSTLKKNKTFDVQNLKLKLFGGPCSGETYMFEPKNKEIIIGRNEDCSIHVDDNMLSKQHCSIEYNPSYGWIMRDGNKKKPSLNGTWLYMSEEQKIFTGMIIKYNQTIFKATLY